jgi:ligand-binding sensor domain-containing protein
LCDNDLGLGGIQEDKSGNIYFNTSKGISVFDGKSFTTLEVAGSRSTAKSEWKVQPDDLWFQGAQNAGVLYRYDGKLLHRLAFPKTKDGDEHYRQMPRDKFPNANFSPYDVYSIFRDSQGNVWFGTSTLGVCRFDGKSFAWLPESELRNTSFGTRSIVEDQEGRFWFCNTLYRYEVDQNGSAGTTFRRVQGIRDVREPSKELIRGIMSSTLDSSGALWMATYQDGVWRYDGSGVTHFPVEDGDKAVNTFSIYRDRQGTLWLGTQEAGAYKFNGKTFEKFRP